MTLNQGEWINELYQQLDEHDEAIVKIILEDENGEKELEITDVDLDSWEEDKPIIKVTLAK